MKKLFLLLVAFLSVEAVAFGQVTVRGKITDQNGETIIGATVVLKSNRSVGTVTDFDGNYSLKIPDSVAQVLVVSSMSYKTIEETVNPVKGGVLVKNFVMQSSATEIGAVEVVAKASKSKDYYVENLKKNSTATIDFISSETIRKTGDVNIGNAVARVTGVSTTSTGLLTVRGIGDRYVKTSVNGSVIPTLDPFTNNIKLDLFPSDLVDNIIITKSFSPDLPGDWAGAYISVETKDYPEKLSVNVETSIGYNNQSTFQDVLTSQTSSTDWMGYDNGFRDHSHGDFVPVNISPTVYQEFSALGLATYFNSLGITAATPWNETYYKLGLVELGLLPRAKFDDANAISEAKMSYETGYFSAQAFQVINAQAAKSGQSFPNNWDTYYETAPLNFSQSFTIGNQTMLFKKPLGVIAGFRYQSSILYDPEATAQRAAIDQDGNNYIASNAYGQVSKKSNGWNALFSGSLKLNPNNSVSLLFMPNVLGVNNVRNSADDASEYQILVLSKYQYYEQRQQLVYQFKSEHFFPASKMKMEVNASYTDGESSAPDFKRLTYSKNPTAEIYQIGGEKKINRFFRYLDDDLFDSRLSFELPIQEKPGLIGKIKFGGAYQQSDKQNDQYDYFVTFGPHANLLMENGDVQQFFDTSKFGISSGLFNGIPYSSVDIFYNETGNPSNHTFGYTKIAAGYMMADYSLTPRVRLAGGLRVEHAEIYTDAVLYDALGYTADDPRRQYPGETFTLRPGELDEWSFLPSVNLIYKLRNAKEGEEGTLTNLRLNFSQTVARPSIRELSDAEFFDYELNGFVYGNSDLKMVRIDNYDVRMESFFKSGDNFSVSLFYKNFKDHIEVVGAPLGYTWTNVDKSFATGIELEGKKSIGRNLDLRANLTLVKSETNYIHKNILIDNGIKTYIPIGPVSRTMYGQAPWVVNAMADYKLNSLGMMLTVSYNVQGPRLVIGAFEKFQNVYELPRHVVDIKVSKNIGNHFVAGFKIRDVFNTPVRKSYNYDEGWIVDYENVTNGTNYIVSLSYKL